VQVRAGTEQSISPTPLLYALVGSAMAAARSARGAEEVTSSSLRGGAGSHPAVSGRSPVAVAYGSSQRGTSGARGPSTQSARASRSSVAEAKVEAADYTDDSFESDFATTYPGAPPRGATAQAAKGPYSDTGRAGRSSDMLHEDASFDDKGVICEEEPHVGSSSSSSSSGESVSGLAAGQSGPSSAAPALSADEALRKAGPAIALAAAAAATQTLGVSSTVVGRRSSLTSSTLPVARRASVTQQLSAVTASSVPTAVAAGRRTSVSSVSGGGGGVFVPSLLSVGGPAVGVGMRKGSLA
jgi:hypothetical protein